MKRGRPRKGCRHWAPSQKAKLSVLWNNYPQRDILAAFPGRSWQAITQQANSMGLRRDRRHMVRLTSSPADPIMETLRHEREKRGLTAAALSRKLGMCSKVIARYERGTAPPTYEALNKWCEALGVELTIKYPRSPISSFSTHF